jgi:hypothetical protein
MPAVLIDLWIFLTDLWSMANDFQLLQVRPVRIEARQQRCAALVRTISATDSRQSAAASVCLSSSEGLLWSLCPLLNTVATQNSFVTVGPSKLCSSPPIFARRAPMSGNVNS